MTLNQGRTGSKAKQVRNSDFADPASWLQDVLRRNRRSGKRGSYAVCSAHPHVIAAAIQQSLEDDSFLHLESTSSQVNQFGGYIGQTPQQFAQDVRSAAQSSGLHPERVLFGGDHLGPFPWKHEPSSTALEKAGGLVRDCVLAGYVKIHLDASMPCADDQIAAFTEDTVAERAAMLCQVAEKAYAQVPKPSWPIVYVVGTEVPAPGGESLETEGPTVTSAEHVHRTLETFRRAFEKRGLMSAWERVIALVVQPGVDFGAEVIFDYDPAKAGPLSAALSSHPGIVYEAHSTDYQTPEALEQMVQGHFAILKVGPWLTFAVREALLALAAIERELLDRRPGSRLSQVREALEEAMLLKPGYWKSYYQGDQKEVHRNLTFGYSDRSRYYWNEPSVQREVARLFGNLEQLRIPSTVLSQFMPLEYEAVRAGQLQPTAESLIQNHVRHVLRIYSRACAG